MEIPFAAYKGDSAYIFVCYSHDDQDVVYPEILWLGEKGINIWYDEGILAGKAWRGEIAEAIQGASKFLYYISRASLKSAHCNREIEYAIDRGLEIVPVYLDKSKLSPDLDLVLHRVQALHHAKNADYKRRLLEVFGQSIVPRSSATIDQSKRRFRRYLLFGVTLAALIGLASWYLPILQEAPLSVAVLAFSNQSDDQKLGYYADALVEDISSGLSRTKRLQVATRTSTQRSAVAAELSTAYVVEGSVRRSGETVHVSVSLVRADDGFQIWTHSYDEPYAEVIDIDVSLAPNIALAVENMVLLDWTFDKTYATQNAEARQLFLTARRQWTDVHLGTGDWRVMVRNLERALELEPNFTMVETGRPSADPYLGLAMAYANRLGFSIGVQQALPKARDAIDRALHLEPEGGHILVSLAQINRDLEIDYESAEANLHEAMEIGIDNVTEDFHLGQLYMRRGQIDEALERFRSAEEAGAGADQPYVIGLQGQALMWGARYAEAKRKFDEALTTTGRTAELGVLLAKANTCHYLGDEVAANEALDKAWDALGGRDPSVGIANLASGGFAGTFARLGRIDEARRLLEVMEEQHDNDHFVVSSSAFYAYYHLGDIDNALVWLGRSIADNEYWVFGPIRYAKHFERLRQDPRFAESIRRIEELESGVLSVGVTSISPSSIAS